MIGRILIGMVRVYQFAVSPLLPPACRFYPSCSEYTALAIRRHGALWGPWLGLRRVLKCHPWHPGGVDPVPDTLNTAAMRRTTARPNRFHTH